MCKTSPEVKSELSTLIVRQNHTFFKVKAKTRKPSFMKGKNSSPRRKGLGFVVAFHKKLYETMSSNQKKKRIPLTKKNDKKGGHGTFVYFFALSVISTWTPKIILQRITVTGQKILNSFCCFSKKYFRRKKGKPKKWRIQNSWPRAGWWNPGAMMNQKCTDSGVVPNFLSVPFQQKVSNCNTSHIHCLKHAFPHFLLLFSI